ncbi:hypothetical protein L1987_32378 [Smallanthus sonchifolius]|uniref:Uncharacterized protein n=1 Tax=Smallanthus sonchifolius TaxID=185202 RepID=A0ACB9HPE2_9ASTR|nr:hypothetical protein L1987_32378 [Smallanthus sonchifolius]
MGEGEETPHVENRGSDVLNPNGDNVTGGEGSKNQKSRLNDSEKQSSGNIVVTPEFLRQNRHQILALLHEEEKERQLKEIRTRLEFGDDDDDDSPKKGGDGKDKTNDNEAVRQETTKRKLDFEDDYSKPYRPSTARSRSKFINKIAEFTFPPKLKMPSNVGKYDGLGDPDDHLAIFIGAAEVEQWSIPVWCHMFMQTLTGAARVWFDSLPVGEIGSFEQLEDSFLKNFSQQRRSIKDPTELHNIKRADNESVGDFIPRFVRESMQVKGAGEDIRISAFIHGVRSEQLVERFHENRPKTVEEMLERAKAFVRGRKASDQLKDRTQKKTTTWDIPRRQTPQKTWDKPNFQPRFQQRSASFQPRFAPPPRHNAGPMVSLPPLTKTPSEILATENVHFVKPAPMRPGPKKATDKYCEFHRDNGHTTDECFSLRRQIESAIKTGKLAHLLKELKATPQSSGKRKEILMVRRPSDCVGMKRSNDHMESWMEQEISFPPIRGGDFASGALHVTADIAGHQVRRVYVDTGSASEIMYERCFMQLDEEVRKGLVTQVHQLTGFSGEVVQPLGKIQLQVTMGNETGSRTVPMTFLIVCSQSSHNVILGRPGLCALGAVISTVHGAIKFPTPTGVVTLYSTKECKSVKVTTAVVPKVTSKQEEVAQEEWALNPEFPEQKITVGSQLEEKTKKMLKQFLLSNLDVFAWQPSDMVGVPRDTAEHRLNTYKSREPVAQKRRHLGPERNQAVLAEVEKLLYAGIVREVKYQTWVANPVMVKKGDGTWRMCIDFKDLNAACPKDCYPLTEIDSKVDALAGFPLKCFLDAYKGYWQVQMAKEDEDKTAFYTSAGIFCFTKMPFGLKNAGATYQRLMDAAFNEQIGRNLEVYVDDLVVKSKNEEGLLRDIGETFKTLRNVNMKLNPKKCSFGVEQGKFLGVVVTKDGFQANPEKVKAVLQMSSPRSVKDVQTLNGRLVALNRFLSKHAERTLPFMVTLRNCLGKKNFVWSQEAEKAFEEMKKYLSELPTLTAPVPKENLTMYLSAGVATVSAVLMTERGGVQTPIYFISRALKDPETRYSPMEKLVLSLVHASRRLRRYFQAHNIEVQTEHPIQQVLRRPEISGRLAKWAIELGAFELKYKPRLAMKGQVVADFLVEIPKGENMSKEVTQGNQEVKGDSIWSLHTDGASNDEGSGAGLILVGPDQIELTYALRLDFKSSNNEAEYEALLAGLRLAQKMGVRKLHAHVDSMLVANQINGSYDAKEESMKRYLKKAQAIIKLFDECKVIHIPRSKNKKADALSKLASVTFTHLAKEVRVEVLESPSIADAEINTITGEENPTWMTPIIQFLTNGTLPEDRAEARKIRTKALQYEMEQGRLYRRSYLGPLLKCLDDEEANYVIREIHFGICGIHAGPRMVVAKAMGAGYYWPGMHKSAVEEIQKCESCQKHAPMCHRPPNEMVPVTAAWPFQKWAIDIVGPFPEAPGKIRFLIVAIDYFTKWVEAKALASITGIQVKKFVWECIVCRFGLPLFIVTDNGKQFVDNPFKQWCMDMKMQQIFTSVAHPQGNGQVERANRSIVEGIKTRLGNEGRNWLEELPHVLWAHRTMPKTSNGESPFSLTYGTEAVIPAEIIMPTRRVLQVNEIDNDSELRLNLNLLEERRMIAATREAKYKREVERYYNSRVQKRLFKEGEYVLRSNEASRAEDQGKLGPRWEGPYQVKEVGRNGSYKLARLDGSDVPRTWNGAQLRKCYM